MKKKYVIVILILIVGNLLFSSSIAPAYYELEDMEKIDTLESIDPTINTYVFVYSEYNSDSKKKINEFLRIFYYSTVDDGIEFKRFDLAKNLECINEQVDKCLNITFKEDPVILNMYDNQITIYDEDDIDDFLIKYY